MLFYLRRFWLLMLLSIFVLHGTIAHSHDTDATVVKQAMAEDPIDALRITFSLEVGYDDLAVVSNITSYLDDHTCFTDDVVSSLAAECFSEIAVLRSLRLYCNDCQWVKLPHVFANRPLRAPPAF